MEIKSVATKTVETPEAVATSVDGRKRGRKKNIIVFTVISLINVVLLVVLFTQLFTPRAGSIQQTNDPSLVGDIATPLVGKPAPNFTLTNLMNGQSHVQLSQFKGKAVILNFWGSWCDTCNTEAPFLQRSWPQLQSKGVVLVGIDDGTELAGNARAFVQKYGITYLNLRDTSLNAVTLDYGTIGKPQTFFINPQGVIVSCWIGPLDANGLQKELAKLHLQGN
ncbi:MAG TPA: TlpA disulfide reductase family protein [Dictyobacter sp.]|jgi:cytochrome c biogenesis protein CcmG/thiol:disulfide interchange protein DsbE|nr:TlpA disulfide reductase family protein [Dictyobacter sp.]